MRKKWMSSTLALVLAGTTVEQKLHQEQRIMLIQKKEKIATQELQKAKHFRHWIR